jgi:hypothetical protein
VIGLEMQSYYDPDRSIRFCFGVATYVHQLLLRLGYPPEAIAKAFVIGHGTWRDGRELFHQSTVVLADDGKWYALEQHFASAKPVEEWFHHYYNQSNDGKTRLYITDPNRFTPELSRYDNFQMGIWGDHERGQQRSDAYRGYFRDLYEWLNRPLNEQNFDITPPRRNLRLDWVSRMLRSLY